MNTVRRDRNFTKLPLMTTSIIAIAMVTVAMPAAAQKESSSTSAADSPSENVDLVVTGTRIVRDGYKAPTPLTVVSSKDFEQAATSKVIDYLTTLPSFAGNYTPQNSTQNASSGTAGTSSVNLRNLGPTRTLVLINGQRVAPSTISGLIDINTIPLQLIKRVDVVTGGASAAYGSDAVSGVVNFILDTKFTGVKGEVSGGVTTYGDDRQYSVALTAGTGFAGGRGHIIVSGSVSHQDGALSGDRDWNHTGIQVMTNPLYGTGAGQSTSVPQRLRLSQVGLATATPGGLIVSGPLKGVAFGPGGSPYNFNYGSIVSGIAMSGGDWKNTDLHTNDLSIDPAGTQRNAFARASYEITDNIEIYGESTYYQNRNFSVAFPNIVYFSGNLTLNAANPFLPASVRAAAAANGLSNLTMGSSLTELGSIAIQTERKNWRNLAGLKGTFDALGSPWSWNTYYQAGVSRSSESALNSVIIPRLAAAIDAVVNPTTGAIVCRSTLTNPTNGCVPYNVVGTGVASQAAKDYVTGTAHRDQRFVQKVVAASISGEPLSNWAGPISLAIGAEHRFEQASGSSTDLDKQRVFLSGNYQPTFGSFQVTEGFIETVIPLAKEASWAKSLELNAAGRFTDYSTSGSVTTWKIGAIYQPFDGLTFRATRSRDIRAPNLNDLYNAGVINTQTAINNTTGQTVTYVGTTRGNPALEPEKADTTGIGVVAQPRFLPGLSASVDFWNINVRNAITTVSGQQIVDLCSQGAATFCQAVNNGAPLSATSSNQIAIQPFNLARQLVRGIDVEASYRTPLSAVSSGWNGDFGLRLLSTFYLKNYSNTTLAPPTDSAGANRGNGPPDYRITVQATYSTDRFNVTLTDRIVSPGVLDTSYISCTSSCPVSTTANNTINDNHIDGAMYFDLSLAYTFKMGSAATEAFLNIKNVANKNPVAVPDGPSGVPFDTLVTNPSNYDILGRVFRVGVRVKI
jgi:iron complex outermembrane receptor protein